MKLLQLEEKSTDFFQNNGIEYIQVDICNEDDFKKFPTTDVYAVVNLTGILPAYLKKYDSFIYVETNIKESLRILEYARIKVGVDRVLYTQTWAEMAGYWGKGREIFASITEKIKIYRRLCILCYYKMYDSRYYGVL